MSQEVNRPDLDLSDVAEQRAWNALAERMAREGNAPTVRRFGTGSRVWIGAAAAVLLLGIGLTTWKKVISTPVAQSETVYRTVAGQRAELTLPDGTHMVLAPATTLRAVGRTVTLDGQAMFRVLHSDGEPFQVVARGIRTTVLGTTFGVRAYNDVKVAVQDGKVTVNDRTLSAGDIAIVTTAGTNVQHNADVSSELAFSRGELIFRDVPLPEAIADLNRWYDTDIRLADPSLNKLRISATFAAGSSAELIQLLEPTLQVRIERNGRILKLSPQ